MSKQRTITLTGRPPVRISEESWPVIASAAWGDFDNQYEFQANRKTEATIMVRRHADGRVIAYGTYRYTTQFANDDDVRVAAGSLIGPEADIAAAIRETADYLSEYESLPDGWQPEWRKLADECIADLPAEEI